MISFRQQAEKVVDGEEEREREAKISRLQADLEVKEQSRQWASQMAEGRDRWAAEEQGKVRKLATERFGEIGEQIDLRLYHLLSLEGQRSCFLFHTRDRLEDARIVAERAGFGLDSYADHIHVHARDLADGWGGEILAVEPSNEAIFNIAKRRDERAQKATRA